MPSSERFSEVAPLPPHGEWRRVLALDRGAGMPRPVALSFLPASVVDDPARLAAVVRDVEAAGRLHHPGAVAVLGLETIGDALAIVEAFVPGVTLRALLDAAGRLPPDLAARIAVDVCAAVGRAHAIDAGDGHPVVHGAISPSCIVIAADGAARLAGFGAAGGTGQAEDVRAIGAVLHECLSGEAVEDPPRALDAPGVPTALAAAAAAATGATGPAPASPAALAQAVVAGGAVSSHADVAAYAEAILPAGEGARGEQERALATAGGEAAEEISADLIVEPSEAAPSAVEPAPEVTPGPAAAEPVPSPAASHRPAAAEAPASAAIEAMPSPAASPRASEAEVALEPLPRPPATRPGVDPAGVFAAPRPLAPRSRLPLAVALVSLAAGFGAGFLAGRRWAEPVSGAPGAAAERGAPTSAPPSDGSGALAPGPAAAEAAPEAVAPEAAPPVAAPPVAKAAAKPGRAMKSAARPRPSAPGPRAALSSSKGTGFLDVTAPAEADVFLDGRRIGRGGLRVEVAPGPHRIEVRLGESRAAERFELSPGEIWTYEVTPTR